MILLIVATVLVILSAIFEAVMDTLSFHYYVSRFNTFILNDKFWNPELSHLNKYKDSNPDQGEKFLGSTTIFVFRTDAWHLFKFLNKTCLFVGLGLIALFSSDLICVIISLISARIIYGLTFTKFLKLMKSKNQ